MIQTHSHQNLVGKESLAPRNSSRGGIHGRVAVIVIDAAMNFSTMGLGRLEINKAAQGSTCAGDLGWEPLGGEVPMLGSHGTLGMRDKKTMGLTR